MRTKLKIISILMVTVLLAGNIFTYAGASGATGAASSAGTDGGQPEGESHAADVSEQCNDRIYASIKVIYKGPSSNMTPSFPTQISYGEENNNCYYYGTMDMTAQNYIFYNGGPATIYAEIYYAGYIDHQYCISAP